MSERTFLSGELHLSRQRSTKAQKRMNLTIKDDYTFNFLDLEEEHSERELERAILNKINSFLQEMGGVFSFIGNQYKIKVGEKEFFIDLLYFQFIILI